MVLFYLFCIATMFKYIIIFCLLLSQGVFANSPMKRELRAAWIATVGNIDWPSEKGLPVETQKQQFITRIDELKALGCNAVIVQIRPASDAFYKSEMEPWSHYLTGKQGVGPDPYYDPLEFMIEEAHKRNMEFHAWFNPFRALVDSKQNPNPTNHITRTHPDWIISYGGKSYIDPGMWPARDYVTSVIMDVVKRYDIDGVHLDDYFYPYRIAGVEFGDNKSYQKYGQGRNKGDWRRDNVSQFVQELNKQIKQAKPYVKFGISPFGVWRNKDKDPEGSETHGGQTCYDDLYSDVILWQKKGWVDYLMPQLYWEHSSKAVPFGTLLSWWNAHSYGRHMYIGLGVYRMSEKPTGPWKNANELLWQIRDIRSQCTDAGCSYYSASCFNKAGLPIKDSLCRIYNKYPAFPPTMKWIDSVAPAAPVLHGMSVSDGFALEWEQTNPTKEPLKYVIYRFVNGEAVDVNKPDHIVSVQQSKRYVDAVGKKYKQCVYVVTAMDRTWNESKMSNGVTLNK
jgi:uncharacterized lipoprotein YddW (UPF0748 family)